MIFQAVVLAGGLGTRLRPAVPDVPKPMASVQGRPFCEWLLDYWIGQGIRRFVLSIGYMAEVFRSHFGCAFGGAEIVYAVEDSPLGTGGALLNALRLVEHSVPCLVLNGDTLFRVELAALERFHALGKADASLAVRPSEELARFGTVRFDADGRIREFGATVAAGGVGYINGGVYLLSPSLMALAGPPKKLALEQELIPAWIRDHRIMAYVCRAAFIDIGVPESYRAAQTLVPEGLRAALPEPSRQPH